MPANQKCTPSYRFFLVAIAITDEDKKRLCNRGRRKEEGHKSMQVRAGNNCISRHTPPDTGNNDDEKDDEEQLIIIWSIIMNEYNNI